MLKKTTNRSSKRPTAVRRCSSKRKSRVITSSRKGDGNDAAMTEDTIITDPRPTDVLLGRGNGVSTWRGNMLFRQIVWDHRPEYSKAGRFGKSEIAEKIVQQIAELSPPGRFLETLPNNGGYKLIDTRRSMEKTCQALREKKITRPPLIDPRFADYDYHSSPTFGSDDTSKQTSKKSASTTFPKPSDSSSDWTISSSLERGKLSADKVKVDSNKSLEKSPENDFIFYTEVLDTVGALPSGGCVETSKKSNLITPESSTPTSKSACLSHDSLSITKRKPMTRNVTRRKLHFDNSKPKSRVGYGEPNRKSSVIDESASTRTSIAPSLNTYNIQSTKDLQNVPLLYLPNDRNTSTVTRSQLHKPSLKCSYLPEWRKDDYCYAPSVSSISHSSSLFAAKYDQPVSKASEETIQECTEPRKGDFYAFNDDIDIRTALWKAASVWKGSTDETLVPTRIPTNENTEVTTNCCGMVLHSSRSDPDSKERHIPLAKNVRDTSLDPNPIVACTFSPTRPTNESPTTVLAVIDSNHPLMCGTESATAYRKEYDTISLLGDAVDAALMAMDDIGMDWVIE